MVNVELEETSHTYYDEFGNVYPSVTTVLGFLRQDLTTVNPSVIQAAAARGTAVHAACELIDYDALTEADINPEIVPYLRAYNTFLRDYRPEWRGIEAVVARDDQPGRIAGTIDRYGEIDGDPCIVDIKTVGNPTRDTYISLCSQTAAYAMLLGDQTAEFYRRYGLFLKNDGDYRLVDCAKKEAELRISGLWIFSECHLLYAALEEARHGKKI